jgi:cytochrome c biogenesis protein CcdA
MLPPPVGEVVLIASATPGGTRADSPERERFPAAWRPVLALIVAVLGVLVLTVTPAAATVAVRATSPAPTAEVTDPATLLLFHGEGCPRCAAEREYLVGLAERHPDLVIREYEVWNDVENQELLMQYAEDLEFEPAGVPVTIVGDQVWIGFSEPIAAEIEAAVEAAGGDEPESPPESDAAVEVPLLGTVSLDSASLVAATLAIGFVDGINPCSLWVLSVLLAIVLHGGSRGRVALVGSVFLAVTASMYGLYIVGFYSALDYASELDWIALVVAAVAFTFGVLQLKDGVRPGHGPSLSIAPSRKPGIYRRMRGIAAADRGVAGVLAGTVVLAVGVSLLETPCTAGLPLLWTNMLAQQGVATGTAVALFGLYMAVFLLDELIIFGVAVFTLRATRMQEEHGRALKIIAGSVMVALAVAMVVAPEALTTLTGTAVVFGVAALTAAAVWTWVRSREPSTGRTTG